MPVTKKNGNRLVLILYDGISSRSIVNVVVQKLACSEVFYHNYKGHFSVALMTLINSKRCVYLMVVFYFIQNNGNYIGEVWHNIKIWNFPKKLYIIYEPKKMTIIVSTYRYLHNYLTKLDHGFTLL